MAMSHRLDGRVDEWDVVMRVNLRGIFLACKAVLPSMRAQPAVDLEQEQDRQQARRAHDFLKQPESSAKV